MSVWFAVSVPIALGVGALIRFGHTHNPPVLLDDDERLEPTVVDLPLRSRI